MKKSYLMILLLLGISVVFAAPARVHQSPINIYVTLNQSTNITSTNITQMFQGVTIPAENVTTGVFTGTLFSFSGNLTIRGNTTINGTLNLSSGYGSCTLKTTSWGMVICGGDNTSAGAGITSLGGSVEGIVQTNPAPVTTTGNVTFNTTAFNQTYDGRYLSVAGVRLPIANITNYIGWTLPFTNITGYNVGGVTVPWSNITGFPSQLQLTNLNVTVMLNVTGDLRANLTNATFPTSDTFTSGLSLVQNITQLKSGILSITYFNLPPYTTSLPFANITGYNVGGVTVPASNVTSGTFGNGGGFTFPLNLTVNGNFTVLNRTNLTAYPDCTLKTVGGLVVCGGDNTSAGVVANPFNQSLNTTDDVAFATINISSIPTCTSGLMTNGNGKLKCATQGLIKYYHQEVDWQGSCNPADAQVYFFPSSQGNCLWTQDSSGWYIPRNGTITKWWQYSYVNGTLGSAGLVNMTALLFDYETQKDINYTTNITMSMTARNQTLVVNDTIEVTQGDIFRIQMVTPNWGTNPTTWRSVWGMEIMYNTTVTFS